MRASGDVIPNGFFAGAPTARLWNRAVGATQGLGTATDISATPPQGPIGVAAAQEAAPTGTTTGAHDAKEGGPAPLGGALTASRGGVGSAVSGRGMRFPSLSHSDSVHSSEILDVFTCPPAMHAQLHGGGPLARAAVRTASGRSAVSRQTSRGSADPGSLGARSIGGRSDNLDAPVDTVPAEADPMSQSIPSTLNTALLQGLPEACMHSAGAAPQGAAGDDRRVADADVAGAAGELDAELEELNLIVQAVSARVGALRMTRQNQRRQQQQQQQPE